MFTWGPQDSIIFWTIWCVLLSHHSILHDLFAWKTCMCSNNSGTHCSHILKIFWHLICNFNSTVLSSIFITFYFIFSVSPGHYINYSDHLKCSSSVYMNKFILVLEKKSIPFHSVIPIDRCPQTWSVVKLVNFLFMNRQFHISIGF